MSDLTADIKTNRGTIHLKLFADKTPMTVANFANLAAARLLRRPHLPSRDPGFHDPGRLPERRRPRRSGLQVRRRDRQRTQARPAGHPVDGQRRAGHERQPVLHHARRRRRGSTASTPCSARSSARRIRRSSTASAARTRSNRSRSAATRSALFANEKAQSRSLERDARRARLRHGRPSAHRMKAGPRTAIRLRRSSGCRRALREEPVDQQQDDRADDRGDPAGALRRLVPAQRAGRAMSPTNEPAMPRMAVMMKPPGSLPGIRNFAMMPTTRPMMKVMMIAVKAAEYLHTRAPL